MPSMSDLFRRIDFRLAVVEQFDRVIKLFGVLEKRVAALEEKAKGPLPSLAEDGRSIAVNADDYERFQRIEKAARRLLDSNSDTRWDAIEYFNAKQELGEALER